MLVFALKERVIHSSLFCVQETSFACFLTTKKKKKNQLQESLLSLGQRQAAAAFGHGPRSWLASALGQSQTTQLLVMRQSENVFQQMIQSIF